MYGVVARNVVLREDANHKTVSVVRYLLYDPTRNIWKDKSRVSSYRNDLADYWEGEDDAKTEAELWNSVMRSWKMDGTRETTGEEVKENG